MVGLGTQASPYQIATASDFNSIRNNLSANYILMNDIDLASYANFSPIGSVSNKFTGVIDGNGYKVKNLKISRNATYTGLISYLENGTIKRLGVIDANVNSQSSNYSGIITGQMNGSALIDQCYSTGILNGQYGQGGIVGWHAGGTIRNCWSNASITSLGRIGGISGNIVQESCRIINCYTFSQLSSSLYVGGLIGSLAVGVTPAIAINSYWNKDIYPTSDAGTGLTTAQFADMNSFSDWDSSIWGFADYPYLKAFGMPSLPAKKLTVSINSYSELILSSLERSKRSLKAVLTSTLPITQTLSKEALAIAESTIDDIVSNVETLQNANIKTHIISSRIEGVGSTAQRVVKATKSVESSMQPFTILTEIMVPVDVERPVYANVYVLENQSNVNLITNKSETSIKENATEMQVV